ncbi:hypothetical protein [Streptomyces sp. NPDC046832]|uniref:hypothetical protein n=1 Tax=Streptomyces sp. NPDC046832 TaxID=3155020 RepID=UPI0033D38EE8
MRMRYLSPYAERVLVGYPRLASEDTTKRLKASPGQTDLPFVDIPNDALPLLDQSAK